MNTLMSELPPLFTAFLSTVLLGFVLGLEVHSYRRATHKDLGLGTTRTTSLLALFGFILAVLDPSLRLLAIGYLILGGLLAMNYWTCLARNEASLLPSLIALLTYPIGALALMHNQWLLIVYAVSILLLLDEKTVIRHLSDKIQNGEAATLAKFLIMAGLILPMLPDQSILPQLSITWSQLWLAIVAVSGISYFGYLVQTYVFPQSGVLMTGILGGMYSSTATTVVLSQQARQSGNPNSASYASAIILATGIMYPRLLVLIALLGHMEIAKQLALPFSVALLIALAAAWLYRIRTTSSTASAPAVTPPSNADLGPVAKPQVKHPLEFSTAVVFALLFVFFAYLTQTVVSHYGSNGLHWLAFVVGFSDINPFILSLLAGHFKVTADAILAAIVIAAASNNLLNASYTIAISRSRSLLPASLALCVVGGMSIFTYFYLEHWL